MKPLRDVDPVTRRARLLAARLIPVGGINRKAILGGYWDGGSVVGRDARGVGVGHRTDADTSAGRGRGRRRVAARGRGIGVAEAGGCAIASSP